MFLRKWPARRQQGQLHALHRQAVWADLMQIYTYFYVCHFTCLESWKQAVYVISLSQSWSGCTIDVFVELLDRGQEQLPYSKPARHVANVVSDVSPQTCFVDTIVWRYLTNSENDIWNNPNWFWIGADIFQDEGDSAASTAMVLAAEKSLGPTGHCDRDANWREIQGGFSWNLSEVKASWSS